MCSLSYPPMKNHPVFLWYFLIGVLLMYLLH
uniref:Uncharacterized protein n=1 Tax=Siphoviridae sp. ctD6g5 TaxID=2826196 RepID=A0A8S5MSB0_9CAUD|nr:MAG TPA: protein of unknown function (DUF4186) [Siphoviridae sp. ctD6g5]